jgi:NADPH:quinone reductase-like Zn-dependent oxidoreductase
MFTFHFSLLPLPLQLSIPFLVMTTVVNTIEITTSPQVRRGHMKAIVYTEYGSPDVLKLLEVEKPVPADNEVLVKVVAASANPLDWHIMRAKPFIARLDSGLLKPKNTRLGADIAGHVEAVGANVEEFKVGDEVFGAGNMGGGGLGCFAEYKCVSKNGLVLKPANISFIEAAAVPVAAFTAVQGLRDTGKIQAGQKVLVNGASGGVGTFAVQIAKSFGAEVTGVCSSRNLELVRSIGADHVIDYTKTDFTRTAQQYDLIYDAVGNRSVSDLQRALSPNGKAVIAGFTSLSRLFEHIILGAWVSRRGTKQIGLMPTARSDKKDLLFMNSLFEAGKVKSVIDRSYPLAETAEAIRYLETGRARGKVVITI